MTPEIERLLDTLSLVEKQAHYLGDVTQRLFPSNTRWHAHRLQQHLATPQGIDQIESFGAKFGRLQDTLVDKLFPRYLEALGERKGPAIDTLNRLKSLGLIEDSAAWLAMRRLRNRLVHEYVEDLDELAAALNSAREAVDQLIEPRLSIRTREGAMPCIEAGCARRSQARLNTSPRCSAQDDRSGASEARVGQMACPSRYIVRRLAWVLKARAGLMDNLG